MNTQIPSHVLTVACLLFLLLPLAARVSAQHQTADRDAKVAVLLDLEGAQASIGKPAMKGFLLGLQEAAIDLTPKLFATLIDTKTDPNTTRQAAEAIVSRVTVGAGFTDNDSLLVAGPVFHDKRIPFLSIGATDPALPETIGTNIFLLPFGDNTQAAAAAEFAYGEFGGTVAILFDATHHYSRTLPQYFRTRFESLGGQVRLDAAYDGGCNIATLGGQVTRLSPQPAFIYLAGVPACIGEVIASLRTAGVHQPIIGGDGLDTPRLSAGQTTPVDGVWYTTHVWLSAETGTSRTQQFIAAYHNAYGTPPEDAFAALGYDAAALLLNVIRRAKDGSSRHMAKALESTHEFQGVTGTISYTKENHVPHKTVWIIRVADGQQTLATSFVPQVVPAAIIPPH